MTGTDMTALKRHRSKGSVALVTGGSRGIGLATALALASRGAAVAVTATPTTVLPRRCRARTRRAGAFLALRADVAQRRRHGVGVRRGCSPASGASTRSSTTPASAVFGNVADLADDDWRLMLRHQRHRRVQRHARARSRTCAPAAAAGSSTSAASRPRRPFAGRRRLLRHQGRGGRLHRGADAGGAARRHPGRRSGARIGRLRRSAAAAATRARGRSSRTTSRRSSWICSATRRAVFPAASRCVRRNRRERLIVSVFDKHRQQLELHETMMGASRGRLAVALDLLTDALAMVGQHGSTARTRARRAGRRWTSPS
jgi:NAD(P)-dependent dehydrogenase (short-subunit alcohol dehydrogenase family)